MNERTDYEHKDREVDGSYYWWINKDVKYLGPYGCEDKKLSALARWFYDREKDVISLYYKGTRLYFTYNGIKYHLSWVFYSHKLIREAVNRLKDIGASNIQINYGELD